MMSDRPRIELNTVQVISSMGAAVTGAVLTSYLGDGGTILGTAVGAGVSTTGFAVYKHYLARTKEKVAPVIVEHARQWNPTTQASGHADPGAAQPARRDNDPTHTDLGQTRADPGQADPDLGQTRRDLGRTGADFGQTRNDLGQAAPDISQTRRDLGQMIRKALSKYGSQDALRGPDLDPPAPDRGRRLTRRAPVLRRSSPYSQAP